MKLTAEICLEIIVRSDKSSSQHCTPSSTKYSPVQRCLPAAKPSFLITSILEKDGIKLKIIF